MCVCVCGVRVCVCERSALNGKPEANGLGYISTWAARVFRQQHVYRYGFAYLLDTRCRRRARRCFDFTSNRCEFENDGASEQASDGASSKTKRAAPQSPKLGIRYWGALLTALAFPISYTRPNSTLRLSEGKFRLTNFGISRFFPHQTLRLFMRKDCPSNGRYSLRWAIKVVAVKVIRARHDYTMSYVAYTSLGRYSPLNR